MSKIWGRIGDALESMDNDEKLLVSFIIIGVLAIGGMKIYASTNVTRPVYSNGVNYHCNSIMQAVGQQRLNIDGTIWYCDKVGSFTN